MADNARTDAHREKMARKKAARSAMQVGFTPVRGKLSDALLLKAQLEKRPILLPAASRRADRIRCAEPASINRHTGKPHQHKREIARRLSQGIAS